MVVVVVGSIEVVAAVVVVGPPIEVVAAVVVVGPIEVVAAVVVVVEYILLQTAKPPPVPIQILLFISGAMALITSEGKPESLAV
jgi:hypothetical protein